MAAAVEVLGSEGHRALTNGRLQEVSGLSRGLVGYHFKSRLGLLQAVVDSIRDDFVRDLVHSPHVALLPGLQATVHLVDTYLRELARDPRRNLAALVLTVASVRELPELQQAIGQLNESLRRGVADLLRRGQGDRTVRNEIDVDAAAAVVVAMLRGVTLQWLADSSGFNLAAARDEIAALVDVGYGSLGQETTARSNGL